MKSNKFRKLLSLALVLVMLLSFGGTAAFAADTVMEFTWNGAQHTITSGQSGSGTGVSWTCDSSNNFSITFTQSGTFVVTKGTVDSSTAEVIGGGAGGDSASGAVNSGRGGNGGGGGERKTQAVTVTTGTSYSVIVGAGGTGGAGTSSLASSVPANKGTAGGDSTFGSVTASGGAVSGGGDGAVGNAKGGNASAYGGGGGGSVHNFWETDTGNYSWSNYSCFICGVNEGYVNWGDPNASWLNQHARNPGDCSGGSGSDGGGAGGSPENEHGHGPRDGAAGTAGTGGGGGGGAFSSRVYRLGGGSTHAPTGSALPMGFGGGGGAGGSGLVTLSGHAVSNGNLKLTKTSTNPSMTDNNSCYSLEGATFGVYKDAACATTAVGTLVTDVNGASNTLALAPGTYYVKETVAPKGYMINTQVKTVTITTGQTTSVSFADDPLNDPVAIMLNKVDAEGNTLEGASLEGAQFTIKYFDGYYTNETLPATATRTWVIETKLDTDTGRYIALLNSAHLVSGDAFYTDVDSGRISFPLGTISIEETKAPTGYKIGGSTLTPMRGSAVSGVYVTQITSSSSGVSLIGGNEFENEEHLTKVSFSKQLLNGNTLSGAELQLKDSSGTVIDTWTSGTEAHVIEGLVAGASYTLHESKTPAGYATAADVTFTVDTYASGTQEIVMVDKPTTVSISKQDIAGDELPGASLKVTDAEGKVIDEWTSTTTAHVIEGLEVGKTYTLHEDLAPIGYAIANDVTFTVTDTENVQSVVMVDEIISILLSKQDFAGEELPGASLKVTDAEGNVIDEWISTDEPHIITGLEAGKTYTMHEDLAPLGYVKASDVEFTVSGDSSGQKVVMVDKIVTISKQNFAGEELPGASLKVTDAEGNVIDEWVSTDEPHVINGVELGKTYTLTEDLTPLGYVKASEIEFTVRDDNADQEIVMVDKVVTISKQDIAGEELPGASLKVTDEDGNVVDEWTSTDEPHIISGLEVGKTYTLSEDLAPIGYATASDVEFTVTDDGIDQEVVMVDEPTQVAVTKKNIAGDEIVGAEMQLFDSDGKLVEKWISEEEPHIIENLQAGKEYILHESLAPLGYKVAQDVKFLVRDTGEVQDVFMVDEYDTGVGKLIKLDAVFGTPVAGAEITIVDKADNSQQVVISDNNGFIFFEIKSGHTYEYRETKAPAGYVLNTDTYTVTVNDDMTLRGTTTFKNVPVGTVVLEKFDLTNGAPLEGATFLVKDKDGNKVFEGSTDTMGRVYFPAPDAGDYTFTEIVAPNGYVLKSETMKFHVDEAGIVTGDTKMGNAPVTPPGGGNYPKTSDETHTTMWAALFGVAVLLTLASAYFLFLFKRGACFAGNLEVELPWFTKKRGLRDYRGKHDIGYTELTGIDITADDFDAE